MKYLFITQNIDYIANSALDTKDSTILSRFVNNILTTIHNKQELTGIQQKIADLYQYSYLPLTESTMDKADKKIVNFFNEKQRIVESNKIIIKNENGMQKRPHSFDTQENEDDS